ncbi:DsbA family protein [Tropicibacter oceani]|uniref:DsbA family protein n=1 Tax=Tropicibacter oceani TaxID=3058420 RepID=A0ABY8QK60_9RHOB|nr:DsbA family protein [Tropicibacter oceani]WGW04900.1 DsbA family protein [Tropicibacter oceani]
MNRMIAIAAVLIALGGAGYWWVSQPDAGSGMAAQAQTVSDTPDAASEFGITEMTIGDPAATLEVIEYASYTCPHCATAHANLLPQLKANYVDTGKIRFTYREVYFDKYGMWASLVARCGGPEKFFGISDLIYKGQAEWSRAGGDGAIAEELRKIGRLAGIDADQLEACLTDGEKLEKLVSWYQANATAHGIDSTPSFVIDGKKYANMSYADFAAILDEKLAE